MHFKLLVCLPSSRHLLFKQAKLQENQEKDNSIRPGFQGLYNIGAILSKNTHIRAKHTAILRNRCQCIFIFQQNALTGPLPRGIRYV